MGYADAYLKIYLLGTPCTMLATGLNGFINALGHPRIGMGTTLLGAALNLVLDPLFIFVFGMGGAGRGHRHCHQPAGLDDLGAALFLPAPGISCRIRRQNLRLRLPLVRDILGLGIVRLHHGGDQLPGAGGLQRHAAGLGRRPLRRRHDHPQLGAGDFVPCRSTASPAAPSRC